MKIHFLFGTETGNSEMVCEDIEIDLGDAVDTEITNLSDFSHEDFGASSFYICVTSTYGNGDLPITAQPFVDRLKEDKPDLSHVRFAIFELGDMVFSETLAHGSKTLMEELLALNATMVGECGLHDASNPEMLEALAIPWAHEILAESNKAAA